MRYSMNRIENGIYTTNGLSTETHKSFPIHYGLLGGGCLKSILTNLDCTKYYEIDVGHLHIQKHVSYKKKYRQSTNIMSTGSHKSFPIRCILWGKILKLF